MSTIIDVANLAGVSTATVSRVINSPDKVRPETREKVQRAMKLCRYNYNALARGFITKHSRILGIIIPSITNPIFAESTRGIQDIASARGYHTILGNTDYQPEKEAKFIQVFREMQVDGMLVTTTNLKSRALQNLTDDRFPFILLYSTVRQGPLSTIGIDNFLGGYQATEYLIQHGHRRIAMLAGDFSISDKSFHRWHGYRKCLKDHNISYQSDLLVQSMFALENGKKGIIKLLSQKKRPTAAFCANDFLAIGAMEGARELGLRIPDDLSVVGFGDIPLSAYLDPCLSTIRQPAYDMGERGAEVLLDKLITTPEKPHRQLLDIELIERNSVSSL